MMVASAFPFERKINFAFFRLDDGSCAIPRFEKENV